MEESFWERWRAPESSAELVAALVANAFRSDLEVERQREEWRKAAGLPQQRQRMVRKEWRDRIFRLRTLGTEEKQRLAAALRSEAMMEARLGPTEWLTLLLRILELPEGLDGAFREAFSEEFGKAMVNGAEDTLAHIGVGQDWLLKHPEAVEAMQGYAGHYGDRISKLVPLEYQVELKKALVRGLDEGMSASEMGAEIRKVFDDLRGWEAERIARTEAVRARTMGRQEVYLAHGVRMLTWVVGINPCEEICAPRAGKQFPAAQIHQMLPAHPHCQCDAVASLDDLDRLRAQALAGTGPVELLGPEPMARYAQSYA